MEIAFLFFLFFCMFLYFVPAVVQRPKNQKLIVKSLRKLRLL